MRTALQHIECFHLVLLRTMEARLDRAAWVVKGGVNLRAWFGSLRFSEDMDIDVSGLAPHSLRDKLDKLLSSPVLRDMLASQGFEHLIRTTDVDGSPFTPQERKTVAAALERAMGLSFAAYASHVVPYLAAEHQEIFGSPDAWERLRELVLDRLSAHTV